VGGACIIIMCITTTIMGRLRRQQRLRQLPRQHLRLLRQVAALQQVVLRQVVRQLAEPRSDAGLRVWKTEGSLRGLPFLFSDGILRWDRLSSLSFEFRHLCSDSDTLFLARDCR
jgi:hypothetical protein